MLIASMALVAGSEWHRVFGWSPIARPMLVAAIVPVMVVLITRWRRMKVEVSVTASFIVLVWFLALGVLHDSVAAVLPGTATFHDIVSGLTMWKGMLETSLPIAPAPELLVLPTVTIWITAAAGAEIALRTRRGLLAILPLLASFGLAVLFGIGGSGSRVVPAAIFVSCAGLLAALSARPTAVLVATGARPNRRTGWRLTPGVSRAVVAIGLVAVIAALATIVGPSLPGVSSKTPYNPRAGRVPPTLNLDAVNPLVELSAWAQHPAQPLFRVDTTQPELLVLVALDDWSPATGWTTTARFAQFGSRLDASVSQGQPEVRVVQHIVVGALPGPWLPAVAVPISISGVPALVDPSDGVLIDADGSAEGATYTVISRAPKSQAPCELYSAVSAGSEVLGIPRRLAALAREIVRGQPTPCGQAEQLAVSLHHYVFYARAPSGTTLAVLSHFLLGRLKAGGGRGTSEQFAASFAVMARALGMKSRVVLGFLPPPNVKPGEYVATSRDALALPQVDFQGLGWVTFNPTPLSGQSRLQTPPKIVVTKDTTPNTLPSGNSNLPPSPTAHHKPRSAGTSGISDWLAVPIVLVVGGLLFGLGRCLLVAARRRRRRRRRQNAPHERARIHGAWLESVDELRDLGVPTADSLTATEVVASVGTRLNEVACADLSTLGELTNLAVFAPAEPTSEDADRAWRCHDVVAGAVRADLNFTHRALRSLDVRVFSPQRSKVMSR